MAASTSLLRNSTNPSASTRFATSPATAATATTPTTALLSDSIASSSFISNVFKKIIDESVLMEIRNSHSTETTPDDQDCLIIPYAAARRMRSSCYESVIKQQEEKKIETADNNPEKLLSIRTFFSLLFLDYKKQQSCVESLCGPSGAMAIIQKTWKKDVSSGKWGNIDKPMNILQIINICMMLRIAQLNINPRDKKTRTEIKNAWARITSIKGSCDSFQHVLAELKDTRALSVDRIIKGISWIRPYLSSLILQDDHNAAEHLFLIGVSAFLRSRNFTHDDYTICEIEEVRSIPNVFIGLWLLFTNQTTILDGGLLLQKHKERLCRYPDSAKAMALALLEMSQAGLNYKTYFAILEEYHLFSGKIAIAVHKFGSEIKNPEQFSLLCAYISDFCISIPHILNYEKNLNSFLRDYQVQLTNEITTVLRGSSVSSHASFFPPVLTKIVIEYAVPEFLLHY